VKPLEEIPRTGRPPPSLACQRRVLRSWDGGVQ
jgi:hypothetical protein